MTKEELRKKLLSDDNAQTHIIINANFRVLLDKLIEKGVLSQKDMEDMDEKQKELIEIMNNIIIDKAIKEAKGEIEHE